MGIQVIYGEKSRLGLNYESFDDFKESYPSYWGFDRITIIASTTKAIVVPCVPSMGDEKSRNYAGILITDAPTFKLNDSKTT